MITFFGASVTLQKDGYAKLLSSRFKDEVKIFGYGGMHINNAGICFIDNVLSVNPDYCFIDFFSTVYTLENDKTKEYIDTIIYKFSKANCKLVFLFFSKHYEELDKWYTFCKNHLNENNMSYIDINSKLKKIDKNKYLKDSVHTNDYGSKLYADIIFDEFQKIKNTISLPINVIPTNYINIKELKVEKSFDKKIIINGDVKIVGIVNTIGPYSGIINVSLDNVNFDKVTIWDEWCYYTRKHFNLSFSMKNKAEMTILSDSFNTSKCKYKINFDSYKKKMIIHSIYYIGKEIEIINIKDGKNISNWTLSFLNTKGRIIQLLNKKRKND